MPTTTNLQPALDAAKTHADKETEPTPQHVHVQRSIVHVGEVNDALYILLNDMRGPVPTTGEPAEEPIEVNFVNVWKNAPHHISDQVTKALNQIEELRSLIF